MSESVFREPVAPSPETFNTAEFPKSDTQPDGFEGETEVTPSEAVLTGRPPVLVDVLGIRMAYKTFDVEPKSKDIDEYINSEVKRQGLKDSRESYQKVVEAIEKKLGVTEESDLYTKLDKIAEYARIQQKLQAAIKEHEELMAADPLTLPVNKMRKVLQEKYGATTS